MDIKKSPKASLEDKKFLFVLMGLVMVLSLVYIAFEWTEKSVTVYKADKTALAPEEDVEVIQTIQQPPPPPPPPPPQVIDVIKVVDNDVDVAQVDINTEDQKDKAVNMNTNTSSFGGPVEENDDNVVFQVVEKMPSFPGGDAALFKYLSDNIHYPVIAQENGIQGRVICQFVVNRDGSIVDVKVVRSVDPSLDKEAVRVIKSMPKWTPGMQRGKPVRVRYTLPVNFRLQ